MIVVRSTHFWKRSTAFFWWVPQVFKINGLDLFTSFQCFTTLDLNLG